jgi:hypothetical protein
MDIFGNALLDFYKKGDTDILWLHNSYDEPEEMPIDIFFRTEEEMPQLEKIGINQMQGENSGCGCRSRKSCPGFTKIRI